ncbi:DUF4260 domain-containing protein [Orbus sasakiae]|uniref:DUF4260 domain-containing protein n=1 Tax=Orbus sasakiae TaxID=1078475 RepID=A0ABP9N5Q8_9GAMM
MILLLRLENLVFFVASIFAYHFYGYSWSLFAIFFLVPDMTLIGYLINAKVGAILYNLMHSYIGAVIFAVFAFFIASTLMPFVFIWLAHISFDRALGFGLKYRDSFKHTHLGFIGKP